MSAPLPGLMILPASRELAHIERAVVDLRPELKAEQMLRFQLARTSLAQGVGELAAGPLDEATISEWSRRTFQSIQHAFIDLFHLVTQPSLLDTVRADLSLQREQVLAFLAPLKVETQADWAFVTMQLALEAMRPFLVNAPIPPKEELQRQFAQVDFAGPFGASLRVVCFLTLILEAARDNEAPTERHASYASLAFYNAQVLATGLAKDAGLQLDPVPYLALPRGRAARDALLRLLALPKDPELNARVGA